ncbi:hypothetical protein BRC97_06545 [Halobacteriales archaeon QS_6_71_20]|nr:MAG: hypothetical protein BRC97_06545 [Halobacteriales archaeon QS_6_71_20]
MDPVGTLVRIGSLVSLLTGGAALLYLVATGAGVDGVAPVGLFATLALVAGAVLAAVAWGRRAAPTRRETPYW